MKKILFIFLASLLLNVSAYAFFKKDVKAYLCNYQEGVFNNPDLGRTGDPCMEGGPSKYKFYVGGKFKAKEEDACMEFIEEYSDAAEMLRKYPTDAWMIGCDSNWK
jgi:hypothetical protein